MGATIQYPLKAAAMALLLLSSLGVFMLSGFYTSTQGWIDDALVTAWPGSGYSPRVLIIERDAEQKLEPAQIQRLLSRLSALNPQSLVVLNWPEAQANLPDSFSSPLILANSSVQQNTLIREQNSQGGNYYQVPYQLPPLQQGVARSAWSSLASSVSTQTSAQASLEGLAGGREALAPGQQFRVNFIAGDSYLPVVDVQRILAGDLLPQLVKDRVVLIGKASITEMPGLVTPLTRQQPLMTPLQFHGYAIDTLLNNNELKVLEPWQLALLLTSICILMLWGYQYLNLLAGLWLTLALCLGYLVVANLSLHLFNLLLPLLALGLLQVGCFLCISYAKRLQEAHSLSRLFWGLNAKVKARMIPQGLSSEDNPWPQITALINQTLQLKRTILLEARSGDSHLHEIQALYCSLDDIIEKRRDYRRSPYREAHQKKGALRLAKPFLSNPEADEIQYLVPLLIDNKLLGFWAFGIGKQQQAIIQQFDTLIDSFSQQIAELIGQRKQWRSGPQRQTLRALLNLSAGKNPHQALQHTLALIEKRMLSLERNFAALETGTATYDLFGQLTYANNNLESLALQAGVRLYENTALDLLTALTGLTLDQSREHIRDVVIEHKEVRLVAESLHHLGHFDLHLRPFLPDDQEDPAESSFNSYQSSGFMFELVDLSQVSSIAQLREDLLIHYQAQLRNDLGTLSMAHQLIHTPGMTQERLEAAHRMIQQKLTQSASALARMEAELSKVKALANAELFPISVSHLLDRALRIYESRQGQSLDDRLDTQVSALLGLVIVDKEPAAACIVSALQLLIEDSKAGQPIHIEALETQHQGVRWVELTLSNQGYGIPAQKLQALLDAPPHDISHQLLRELILDIPLFANWGATLTISSELDQGYSIRIKMRGLQFHG